MFWLAELAYRNNRPLETRQWLLDLEKLVELNAEVIWLALRTERKLGNREAEARHAGQLRRKYVTSPEHRKLLQGDYE
jgi:type IV pilus assembly protein PilF